jgi:hypothetical protein
MWGLSAGPGPVLRIVAAGTPRMLESEAIKSWM